ncbi:hypothetical protein CQW23_32474 [Capsicum baccatum]|uniref:Pentatricopeptide repeat-containing protein n=1 Tax=Capsicum baccatum TaxID=33114 RepID=A0A2G2V4L3_CAPBA|nr:hypothetical protein CQW23_32474 [Capsicum baccatum]
MKACTGLSSFEKGVKIHEEVVKRNLENDVFIGTALTDMYSKMGDLVSSWKVFDTMPERDVVVWNAMISGVAQCGEAVKAVELFKKMQIVCFPQEALSLFRDMQNEYSQPNNVTLVSVIPACAELRAVRLGKSAHCHAIKASMDSDVSTGTALVSMYAKCNLFNSALNLFNKMPLIEVVTWNALINREALGEGSLGVTGKVAAIGTQPLAEMQRAFKEKEQVERQ